jgi:thiamine biosynthesis lipoprotein
MTGIGGQARLLVEKKERMMATEVSLHLGVAPGEEARARAAMEGCFAWLREVERRLTRFRAESELCQLNERAGCWCAVSTMLFVAVSEAIAAAQASDGLFDPALLGHLEALGYNRDFSLLARQPVAAAQNGAPVALPLGRWREIKLDLKGRRLRLPSDTRLDLGGIAKGWAADRVVKRLMKRWAHVLVNVGGDMRLRGGPQPGESWAVGIDDLRDQEYSGGTTHRAVITFGHGGLATSGATRRWWYHGGKRQHHLLDPRTGQPASLWTPPEVTEPSKPDAGHLIATATALAPTAARAEVAAKVALLRGYPEALRAVEAAWRRDPETGPHLPADRGVALLVILGSGEVVHSANLGEYLETCAKGGMLWVLPARS